MDSQEELWIPCFVLMEVFPTSLYNQLEKDIDRYPGARETIEHYRYDDSIKRRINFSVTGWLGLLSRRGSFQSIVKHAPDLPIEVEGVLTFRIELSESLTVIASCFAVSDEYANLTPLLQGEYSETRIKTKEGTRLKSAQQVRGETLEMQIQEIILSAEKWFQNKFHGTFSKSKFAKIKPIPLLTTKVGEPFDSKSQWQNSSLLNQGLSHWKNLETMEKFRIESPLYPNYFSAVFGKRSNMGLTFDNGDNPNKPSPWSESQEFIDRNIHFFGWFAANELVQLYREKTTRIRNEFRNKKFKKLLSPPYRSLRKFSAEDWIDLTLISRELPEALRKYSWTFDSIKSDGRRKNSPIKEDLMVQIETHTSSACSNYENLLEVAGIDSARRLANVNISLQIILLGFTIASSFGVIKKALSVIHRILF